MTHGGTRAAARVRRLAGAGLALALTLGGLVATSPAGAKVPAPGPADVLHGQEAVFTQHSEGFPLPGTPPSRQLSRVEVSVEAFGQTNGDPSYSVDVFADLVAEPDTWYDDDAQIVVGFGHAQDGGCRVSHVRRTDTSGADGTRYHVFGYTPDYWGGTPDRPWECVLVAVATLDGTVVDGMGGTLVNSYRSPDVAITGVTMLGSSQKKLRLVRNTWTTVHVEVGNSGPAPSPALTLKASGKGLKVRKARTAVGRLGLESESAIKLQVRPTRKQRTGPLRLRLSGPGVSVSRNIKVTAVKPPARPRAGRYRSTSGDVSFRIAQGRVVGFTARMQTQCGGAGTIPTYTTNTYDFPRTKIPRNGIVQASKKGKALGNGWSTHLQMQVRGSKVTHGRFSYGTAGPCIASTGFTAKRVGR